MNSKKFVMTVATSLTAASALMAATDEARMRNLENRLCALENRKTPCCVNPPARPTQKDCWGAFVTIAPVLWEANENGMGFAIKAENGTTLFNSTKNKVKNLNFNWDWGFRLGLGLNLAHDGWDVYLNWTRFNTSAHKSTTAGTGNVLLPVFLHPASLVGANVTSGFTKADWKLRFNQIDLELGRAFFVSKWLTLRPHAGLRTAWIKQKYDIEYKNLSSNDPLGAVERDADMRCRYWGLGIKGGIDTQWGLGCGWSIFANYDAALLWGFFNIDHDEFRFSSTGTKTTVTLVDDHYRIGRALTDFIIGLRYDYFFCNERYHIGLALGWEHLMFFGQNQFIRFVDDIAQGVFASNQGDLTIQGYTLRVRFDF